MNKRLVLRLLGAILLIEALAMAPSLAIVAPLSATATPSPC